MRIQADYSVAITAIYRDSAHAWYRSRANLIYIPTQGRLELGLTDFGQVETLQDPAATTDESEIRSPEPPSIDELDKGNLKILQGVDGQLKKVVTLDIAGRFGGVSTRAIQKAVKKGSLEAVGERQNRRIVVKSLLKYFPP